MLDVRPFREADCDTDHYLVVAIVRERLAVSKRTTHKVHTVRFNLKTQRPLSEPTNADSVENVHHQERPLFRAATRAVPVPC
jgi:hypothetical protein